MKWPWHHKQSPDANVFISCLFMHFCLFFYGIFVFLLSILKGSLCFRNFRLLTLLVVLFLKQKNKCLYSQTYQIFSLVHLYLESYLGNLSLNPDFSRTLCKSFYFEIQSVLSLFLFTGRRKGYNFIFFPNNSSVIPTPFSKQSILSPMIWHFFHIIKFHMYVGLFLDVLVCSTDPSTYPCSWPTPLSLQRLLWGI